MNEKFYCRRFILASVFTVTACGCAFVGTISGVELGSIALVVLGSYNGADVMHKKHKMKDGGDK